MAVMPAALTSPRNPFFRSLLEDSSNVPQVPRDAGPYGLTDLDNAFGRLQRGDLFILAARPADR